VVTAARVLWLSRDVPVGAGSLADRATEPGERMGTLRTAHNVATVWEVCHNTVRVFRYTALTGSGSDGGE
jgi:hypothetical protein